MFISMREWIDTVVHPKDEAIFSAVDLFYNYCLQKYQIAARVQPKVIVEIGVRLGYSAHAFLSAVPNADYYGLDVWGGDHGGTKLAGADYVQSMLGRHFPKARLTLHTCDTQTMPWPSLPSADLFHVDGDHTTKGALSDLQKAYETIESGACILVDDCDFLSEVKTAVEFFKSSVQLRSFEYIATVRGDALLVKE